MTDAHHDGVHRRGCTATDAPVAGVPRGGHAA